MEPNENQEKTSDYVMGRGKIEVDGRYVGITREASFWPGGVSDKLLFIFAMESITAENHELFFSPVPERSATIVYRAQNPVGRQIDYHLEGVLRRRRFDLKSEGWQAMVMELGVRSVRIAEQTGDFTLSVSF